VSGIRILLCYIWTDLREDPLFLQYGGIWPHDYMLLWHKRPPQSEQTPSWKPQNLQEISLKGTITDQYLKIVLDHEIYRSLRKTEMFSYS
jgi:hypothetical protein